MLQGEILVFCLTFVLCRGHIFTSIEKFGSHFNPPSGDQFRLLDSQNSGQIGDHRKLILEETKIIIDCLS